jgi:hypothetical protein
MPRRAPAGAVTTASATAKLLPPPPTGSVLIPNIYARLIEIAREAIAHGDPDPRCMLADDPEAAAVGDPGRFDPQRPGNATARAELAALQRSDEVTVPFWRVMDATECVVMPLFPRGIRQFHVRPDGYISPAAAAHGPR